MYYFFVFADLLADDDLIFFFLIETGLIYTHI